MKIYLFLFLSLFIVMGFASAEISELEPIKVNQCINLPQIEFNTTYQNLTFILTPNKSIIKINALMQKNGYSYNYTFCDTDEVGTYTANGCSDLDCWNYKFKVSPLGGEQTTGQNIVSSILIILIFGIGTTLLIMGFIFSKDEKLFFIGYIMLAVGIGMYIFTLSTSIVYARDIAFTSGTLTTQENVFKTFINVIKITSAFFIPMVLLYIISIRKKKKKEYNESDGYDG